MTRETAKKLLPIIKAYSEGKIIQYLSNYDIWEDREYLDFDEILLDTINVSYKMMEELGIDLKDRLKVTEFYKI